MTTTARTKNWLERQGYTAGLVERFIYATKRRVDFLGFIDIIALAPIGQCGPTGCVGVQCCAGDRHADHRDKIIAEPRARLWLRQANRILLLSWDKQGARGKRKVWTPREEWITLEMFT